MVLQDIERQRVAMQALREHPGVSAEALDAMFQNLQPVAEPLAEQGRIAEELRDNDWLQSLRGRLTVPGCFAQIDVPSYYCWQNKAAEARRAGMQQWLGCLVLLRPTTALLI